MDSVLTSLFRGTYDPTPILSKTQRELLEQLRPLCDQVQETFGLQFLDQLTGLQSELDHISSRIYFDEGFRLGAQLMLEVFSPLTSAKP